MLNNITNIIKIINFNAVQLVFFWFICISNELSVVNVASKLIFIALLLTTLCFESISTHIIL